MGHHDPNMTELKTAAPVDNTHSRTRHKSKQSILKAFKDNRKYKKETVFVAHRPIRAQATPRHKTVKQIGSIGPSSDVQNTQVLQLAVPTDDQTHHTSASKRHAERYQNTRSIRGCMMAKRLYQNTIAGVLKQLAAGTEAQDQKQTAEALLALNHLFPDHALEATKIVDLTPPMRVRTTHSRELYQVTGPLKGRVHITMVREHFCDCADFASNVLPDRSYYCKHLLAVRIATSLGKCTEIDLPEQAFQTLLIGDGD